MLADGRVLAVGGEATSDQTQVTTGVLQSEIWDPATETWSVAASMSAARNYHSTAVLQPDGTVLVAGGGHEDNDTGPGQFSAQVYSPSYLFNGPRPTITSAPAASTYGANMTISTPDASSISAVNLVSLGADTHQADMDQHFVPLPFSAGFGSLTVQAPAAPALAPPGVLHALHRQWSWGAVRRFDRPDQPSPGHRACRSVSGHGRRRERLGVSQLDGAVRRGIADHLLHRHAVRRWGCTARHDRIRATRHLLRPPSRA